MKAKCRAPHRVRQTCGALTMRADPRHELLCRESDSRTGHQDCALRCIASGVCCMIGPDSMLYMLTLDHARAMAPTTFTTPDPLP